jgi:hypothetical protein
MNLTLAEYRILNSKAKVKIDSVLAVLKIKPKWVKGATVIETQYRDTTIEKIVYLPAQKQPDSSFKIAFSSDNGCVGVKGHILSKDPKSSVTITERTANNSTQLIVTKKRGHLWWKKPEKYRALNDCGKVEFTQINFEK